MTAARELMSPASLNCRHQCAPPAPAPDHLEAATKENGYGNWETARRRRDRAVTEIRREVRAALPPGPRVRRMAAGKVCRRTALRDFRAALDLANLEIGWVKFPRGAPPELHLVPAGQDIGKSPGEGFKQGIRLLALLSGEKAAREMFSTAGTVWDAIDDLHDDFLAERDDHPGRADRHAVRHHRDHQCRWRNQLSAGIHRSPAGCRDRRACR